MSIEQNTKILASDVVNSLSEKAPTSHASNDITYGVGTDTDYGHVKLSDSVSTLDSLSGTAVSPKAVDDGLSSLFDDIITAAENAANTTTIPDNVAVELNNKIDELTVKNTEQDEVIAGKLDKSGGTMTGAIIPTSIETVIRREESTKSVAIWGANSYDKGAGIQLYGAESDVNTGRFIAWVASQEDGTRKYFTLYPDGGITWNGKNIVRSVNSVNADSAGNVEVSTSPSLNYAGAISITLPYTAVVNGFIRAHVTLTDWASRTLSVDNVTVVNIASHNNVTQTLSAWVGAGQTVTASGSLSNILFIPCK